MTANEIKKEVSIEQVVAHYGGPVNGNGIGRCLMYVRHHHGDADPSMSTKDGRVRCWSQGCFGEHGADVFELIGIMENLLTFAEQRERLCEIFGLNGHGTKKIVTSYPYTDESGAPLFEVVRYVPKDFRQRRPDGHGGWIWNLKGTRLVPLNLPRLLPATHIFHPEGEKDCETADALGWPHACWAPTCNPMGAGKWLDGYSTLLCGKTVVILPDADEAGEKHLAKTAASLRRYDCEVLVARLPEGYHDLTEWADAIGTQAGFWQLLARSMPWEPSASADTSKDSTTGEESDQETPNAPDDGQIGADPKGANDQTTREDLLGLGLGDFLAQEFPAPEPLIEGILNNDGGGWIGGEEKLGKSYYSVEEALSLSLQRSVCGRFAVSKRRRVLYVEEEDPPSRCQRRVNALLRGYGLDPTDATLRNDLTEWFRISVWSGFTLDAQPSLDKLRRTLDVFRPAVVYLDVLRKLTMRDLNKSDQAGALLKSLDDLRREFSCLFRIVAHYRKIQGSHRAGRGSQELSGSFQLGAWGECSLWFEPLGRRQGVIRVAIQRKDGEPTPPFQLRFESEGPPAMPTLVRLHADELKTTSAAEEWKEKVFAALSTLPPVALPSGKAGVSVVQLAETLSCSDKTIRKALDLLIDEQRCLEIGKLSKGKKLYAVAP